MSEEEKLVAPQAEQAAPNKKPARQTLPPLELLYQQIYDLADNQVHGYEASLRINDRKMGTLLPALVLPIAEKSNRIIELDRWTLNEVAAMLLRMNQKGRKVHRVFVTVSPKTMLRPRFLDTLKRQIEKNELPPRRLCIQIPEVSFSLNSEPLIRVIGELRAYGIKIAIDGFGAESSSLFKLGEHAVDYLKLDESFVGEMENNDRIRDISQSVMDMAEKLGVRLIAEGVNTKSQLSVLKGMNCTIVQGGYFGDPDREKMMI